MFGRGRTLKGIDRNADYFVDFIKFPDRTNVDCRVGMGSRRRRVRGVSRMEDLVYNGARFDEHYLSFLLDLEECVEEGLINEDQDDPEYVMFLDNLKEWGSSYVLNKSISHGVHSRIVYEVETIPFNKVVNKGNVHFGGNAYAPRRNPRSCRVNLTKEKRNPGKSMKRNISSSSSDCYIVAMRNSDFCEKTTPNLKKSDFNYRLKKSLNEDIQVKRTVGAVRKRSEIKHHTDNYARDKTNLNLKYDPNIGTESSGYRKRVTKPDAFDYLQEEESTKKKKTISSLDYLQKERRLNINNDSIYVAQTSGFRKRKTNGTFDYFQEDENTKKTKPISRNCDYLHKKQNLGVNSDSRSAPKKSSDEDYDLFMKNLSVNGQSFIYEDGENERVCYELPDLQIHAPLQKTVPVSSKQPTTVAATLSDKHERVVVMGIRSNAPLARTTRVTTQSQRTHHSTSLASQPTMPPLVKQVDNNMTVAVIPRVGAKMRKRLHEILSKPYSKEEHDELWKTLSTRAAVQIHRDSRSGGSDRPGKMGRSFLDWYPDAKLEIEKVKSDPHKVLNLLRMVSFYVQKLPCGNICKPWVDDTILSILPGSS